MATVSFVLIVSYSLIVVCESDATFPFNMWTDRHLQLGFSWRPESTAFATLEEAETYAVEIDVVSEDPGLSGDAARIIQTPFTVPSNGSIQVASISDAKSFTFTPCTCQLRFECFAARDDAAPRIRLLFIEMQNPSFALLRADAALLADPELLLSAEPA